MANSTLQTPLAAAQAEVAQAERTRQEVQALERQEVEGAIRRAQTAGDAEALAPLLGRREALIHVVRSLERRGQEAAQAVTLARQRVQAVYQEASPTASQFLATRTRIQDLEATIRHAEAAIQRAQHELVGQRTHLEGLREALQQWGVEEPR